MRETGINKGRELFQRATEGTGGFPELTRHMSQLLCNVIRYKKAAGIDLFHILDLLKVLQLKQKSKNRG
jgi:hypothetical protein